MTNIDREEFTRRCAAFDSEEQTIVATMLPNEVLLTELSRRLTTLDAVVSNMQAMQETLSGEVTYGK